eukprot:CAMPEP_0178377288 /NCGR_PEP_ID=MMETSP0689_2-20121128/3842_1 /TAXON_ID=160604 /ORGANISM="Amphidinium massartii, Strain CS-259" /LENGTH=989 /DNA_ID=CAMNT_0019997339 /DNA_START=14 /DNA_END=2980 /DNA_ORIENTATION=+
MGKGFHGFALSSANNARRTEWSSDWAGASHAPQVEMENPVELVVCKPPLCTPPPPSVSTRMAHRLRMARSGRSSDSVEQSANSGAASLTQSLAGGRKPVALAPHFSREMTDISSIQIENGAVGRGVLPGSVAEALQLHNSHHQERAEEEEGGYRAAFDLERSMRRVRTWTRPIPHYDAMLAKLQSARAGSVGASMLNEVASLCSTAFESENADQVKSAVAIACTALGKAALGAVRSTSAASTCAMLVSLLRHPSEECRKAAVVAAAKDLDAGHLLKSVVRGLGGQDAARRWQAAGNALRAVRLAGSGRTQVLERLRGNGGLAMVIEVWRAGGSNADVAQECCALVLLMAPGHHRQVATSGAFDCAMSSWHRFGSEATRGPLLQVLSELVLVLLPHLAERPLALVRLATDSLRALLPSGPATAIAALLKVTARLPSELTTTTDLPDLALAVISDGKWGSQVNLRRLAAESFVRPFAALADGSRSPHSGAAPIAGDAGPTSSGSRPHELPEAALVAQASTRHPVGDPILGASQSANALRFRLECWRARLLSSHSHVVDAAAQGAMDEVPALELDADFESGSLGPVTRLGLREYEIRLLPDWSGSNSYIQWFCFRLRNMEAGVMYTFHLTNLNKPGSLFEEGCQPVTFSKFSHEASGVGWTRQGTNIAYHPCDGGKRHRITFDLCFPYNNDEVFLAHAPTYTHTDLLRDLDRWPHVERKSLAASCNGKDITALSCGDRTKPRVCIIARAHPGETHASWVMRGVLEFLLEGGTDAEPALSNLCWLLVPMLNPDGVSTGRTRTNLGGIDLNRHHHDESAPETMGLRAALQEESDSGSPLLVFIDIHSHSRRRGIFAITNSTDADPLVDKIAARTPLMDVPGTIRSEVRTQDQGVGRVAAAHVGYKYSLTLESSLCARHSAAGEQHLTLEDLRQVGRAVCMAVADLALEEGEQDEQDAVVTPVQALAHGASNGEVDEVPHVAQDDDAELAMSEDD